MFVGGCLEHMKAGAVISIQDMGAAGLTCSAIEMAERKLDCGFFNYWQKLYQKIDLKYITIQK